MMSNSLLLLWLAIGLDLLAFLLSALLAIQLHHYNPVFVLHADGFVFGLCFAVVAWFLGGIHSYVGHGFLFGNCFSAGC